MRLLLSLIASVILGYVVFQGLRMFFLVRVSAKLVERSMAFEQLVSEGTPRILIMGDSTGVGTGSEDPKDSIAGRFGMEFPHAYIQNRSTNGWKVADALRDFPVLPDKSFDVVIVQIGANDILRASPMSAFTINLDAVFKKSRAAGKKVYALHSGNIGLAPLFPWPVSWLMQSRTLRYRAEYRRIAAINGITYVDLYHEASDDPFRGKPEAYAADGLHLTGIGYGMWYRTIRDTMRTASVVR